MWVFQKWCSFQWRQKYRYNLTFYAQELWTTRLFFSIVKIIFKSYIYKIHIMYTLKMICAAYISRFQTAKVSILFYTVRFRVPRLYSVILSFYNLVLFKTVLFYAVFEWANDREIIFLDWMAGLDFRVDPDWAIGLAQSLQVCTTLDIQRPLKPYKRLNFIVYEP